jgi:hypothetical protein
MLTADRLYWYSAEYRRNGSQQKIIKNTKYNRIILKTIR